MRYRCALGARARGCAVGDSLRVAMGWCMGWRGSTLYMMYFLNCYGGEIGGNWGVEWGGRVWGAPPGGGRGASGSVWVDPLLCVLL